MSDFFKERKNILLSFKRLRGKRAANAPGKSFGKKAEQIINCKGCGQSHLQEEWKALQYVCPDCGYHMPISGYERLNALLDEGSFKERYIGIESVDPLKFPGYGKKLKAAREKTGLSDALLAGQGKIKGISVAVAVLDGDFFMGSMGSAVGEKLTLVIESAAKHQLPLIIFSASGGARMQEGLFSLMQMAKTSAAIAKFSKQGGLYISVLTHPTTGGVSASFASLGDLILAEPGALIGFAGPRVIEQTIGETLPEGFQRAEFLMEHGFVDQIVPREKQREFLGTVLKLHVKRLENQSIKRKERSYEKQTISCL